MKLLKIATRQSPLALWQAEFVRDALTKAHPGLQIELVKITTKGDKILDTPLAKIGGKGLFVKELEQAMLDGQADIAVHSMKDVPMEFPEGLDLKVICQREDPHDAFISPNFGSFDDLPQGAVLGTASLRRAAQLQRLRPDLDIQPLRGNVGTRLGKLDAGEYDAAILANAGLLRLGLQHRVRHILDANVCLPAAGQGAVGIEARSDDVEVAKLLEVLDHPETAICVTAERAMNRRLQGGCQVPIAAFAQLSNDQLYVRGLVARVDGSEILKAEINGNACDAEALGLTLAEQLLAKGAGPILAEVGL